MAIIDTEIWIDGFKVKDSVEDREIKRLVAAKEAAVVGMILVEVLRGSRDEKEFDDLTQELLAAQLIESNETDWLDAGRILFTLKRRGEIIPLPDALIAAQALNGGHVVYSDDRHLRRVAGLRFHQPV